MNVPYSVRKLARDLGVVLVGTVLLFVASDAANIGELSADVAPIIGPFALLAYRMLRERSAFLRDSDPQGE